MYSHASDVHTIYSASNMIMKQNWNHKPQKSREAMANTFKDQKDNCRHLRTHLAS